MLTGFNRIQQFQGIVRMEKCLMKIVRRNIEKWMHILANYNGPHMIDFVNVFGTLQVTFFITVKKDFWLCTLVFLYHSW